MNKLVTFFAGVFIGTAMGAIAYLLSEEENQKIQDNLRRKMDNLHSGKN